MRNRSVAISYNGATLALLVLLLVTFVAFLGMTLFNTKGEPREALVAVSMLQQGNWVLPVSCGVDIPYKPPMLAWCIAAMGWLNGGTVTEFLSRLPSALAATVMLICTFRFLARRSSLALGLVTALVAATTFELHRAATSCRVDMLFTAFIVMAILAMYVNWEKARGFIRLPWLGILLMSGAVLTKGPAGMLLPCGVMLFFRWIKGEGFWRPALQLTLSGLLALVLPAIWYVAAYNQGGQQFLDLAMEENFGRFLGKMSYESHEHNFFYNFQTLATGIAPYILLLIFSLFVWKKWPRATAAKTWWKSFRSLPSLELFCSVAAIVIFVFYCIPKSKRSVYLLPMYPFVAYGIALYIRWLANKASGVIRTYGVTMASLGILASAAMLALMLGLIPMPAGSKAIDYIAAARSLGAVSLLFTCVALAFCIMTIKPIIKSSAATAVQWTILDTLFIYWMFSAAIQPMVLNPKSDRPMAAAIEAVVPADQPIYGYMTANMLRYYTAGFYLNDRITALSHSAPELPDNTHGYLLAGKYDIDSLRANVSPQATLIPVMEWPSKSCDNHQLTTLYEFSTLHRATAEAAHGK